jgi:hypothetical protein
MPIGTRKYMPRRTKSKFGGIGGPAYVRRKGTSPALRKVREQLASSRKSNAAARKKLKSNFFSGSGIKIGAVLTISGGGAAAGAARVYMPTVFGFSTPLVLGAGLTAASMVMGDDKIAPMLGAIGAGMLSASAADITESMLGGEAAPNLSSVGGM